MITLYMAPPNNGSKQERMRGILEIKMEKQRLPGNGLTSFAADGKISEICKMGTQIAGSHAQEP